MTPDELHATFQRLGLSQSEASRILHVDPRTVRRWIAGDRDIPGVVVAFLYVLERSPIAFKLARKNQKEPDAQTPENS